MAYEQKRTTRTMPMNKRNLDWTRLNASYSVMLPVAHQGMPAPEVTVGTEWDI